MKVLIFQLGSIGDTVVSIPALLAVRRYFGSVAHISLLHEARVHVKTNPSHVLADGIVDRFISYPVYDRPFRTVLSALRLVKRLRFEGFHAVVYLAPSERPAHHVRRDERFFQLCGISRRIGFRAFSDESLYPRDPSGHPAMVSHESIRRIERLRPDGIDSSIEDALMKPILDIPRQDIERARSWLVQNRQRPDRCLVAVCPGSKQPANMWPLERFIELGRKIASLGKYEIVVVGGPVEKSIGERMVASWGEGLNAAGAHSVLESAALLSQCRFVIGLDTGTTHLAAACGVPCIALYGERNNPGQWEPLGLGHIVLRSRVACAGCRLSACPVSGHPCMTNITMDLVWHALQQMEQRMQIQSGRTGQ